MDGINCWSDRGMDSSIDKTDALTIRSTHPHTAAKEVRFGVDGRAQMLMGVDKLADAVQVRPSKSSTW